MLSSKLFKHLVIKALEEDSARSDITSQLAVTPQSRVQTKIIAKDNGILCGIEIVRFAFCCLDKSITFKARKKDGNRFRYRDTIATISGKARAILSAERVALNFLSLLSGVSTATGRLVEKVSGSKAKILSTRKTTPTLRELEKYAVRIGGGFNHRRSLSDWVLVKDNHLRASGCVSAKKADAVRIATLLKKIRRNTDRLIEVEVENIPEFLHVANAKPDIIMLDNFSLKNLKNAVSLRNKNFPSIKLEASGGVNEKTVRKIALTGVDFISVGNITHSPRAIDFSLEF